MINDTLYSSRSEDWATPQEFFDKLNTEFNFDFDVCATKENTKCLNFFCKEDEALLKDWLIVGKSLWMNPPYGKEISKWMQKAYETALGGGTSRLSGSCADRYAMVP